MFIQYIKIPKYKWKMKVYYAVTSYWTEDIMADLDRIGISEEHRKQAYDNMMSDQLNNGITYSSPKDKRTIMVVAKAESAREYFNSFFHELKHFEEQIGEACNIDQKSEDAAYLRGNVAGMMFDCMAPLLCDCCRRKRHEGYDDEDDF